jgi:hypothetical protein
MPTSQDDVIGERKRKYDGANRQTADTDRQISPQMPLDVGGCNLQVVMWFVFRFSFQDELVCMYNQ